MKMKHIKETEPAPVSGQHTPTPWIVTDQLTANGLPHRWIADCGANNAIVTQQTGNVASREHAQANAAFIVKACNCHDQLVQALQRFAVWNNGSPCFCEADGWNRNDHGGQCSPACRSTRTLIERLSS